MKPQTILFCCATLAITLTACPGSSGGSDLSVSLSNPSGTAYTNSSLTVQATVSGGTPESLELLRNGTSLAVLTAPYAYTWDTSALTEGGYSLGVRAIKGGKTVQGDARTVFVDRTAPTVNLTSATAAVTTAGNLELSADASDTRGIARVEFFDGTQKVGESTSSPFGLSLNLSAADNREHSFSAKVTDRANNSATSTALKVNVLIPKRVSENLIVNGDAEAGPGSNGGEYVSDIPAWLVPYSSALRFTVSKYGTSNISLTDAPPNGGNQFFVGGPDISNPITHVPDSSINSARQIITLSADWNTTVDAGGVTFDLSGYFGSLGTLNDTGLLSAFFLDSGDKTLKTVELKAVYAQDRNNKTGFVRRADAGEVPKQTRRVFIALKLVRSTSSTFSPIYNFGLADNLALVLTAY